MHRSAPQTMLQSAQAPGDQNLPAKRTGNPETDLAMAACESRIAAEKLIRRRPTMVAGNSSNDLLGGCEGRQLGLQNGANAGITEQHGVACQWLIERANAGIFPSALVGQSSGACA